MNTDSTTLYKLMILYMLSKVNFPLSNVQISTFMLDNEYTSYFTFQETINSLVEDSFIQQMNYRNSTQYKLTQEGEDTVAFFYTKISPAIREDIDSYLARNKYENPRLELLLTTIVLPMELISHIFWLKKGTAHLLSLTLEYL